MSEPSDVRSTDETKPPARRHQRRAIALGAATALVAMIVYAVAIRPGSSSVIATAGIIQGDVRVRVATDDTWRRLTPASGPIVSGMGIRATPTGRVALNLTEGASLRLDATTEATIMDVRAVELHAGTAYLDSIENVDADPFVITTDYGDVRAGAAQLEVAVFEDGLRLRVRRGEATLEREAEANVAAMGGEEISLIRDFDPQRRSFTPFNLDWEWAETLADRPPSEGESLLSLLSWVSRETGRDLRFDEGATEARLQTAIARTSAENMSPLEALEAVMSTTDFDYRLRGDGTIVVSQRAR